MTDPTILVSHEDIVRQRTVLSHLKWIDNPEGKAAETLYDSVTDSQGKNVEGIVIRDVSLVIINPEGSQETNAIQGLLNDLEIEHHSEY